MAGVSRITSDIQVNTDSNDYPYGNAPAIVKLANGGFMILWSEDNLNRPGGTPADAGDVRAEIFTATGAKVGSEFIVNTTTAGQQGLAKAAVLADGTIFVVWADDSQTGGDASGFAIKGQLLSATGAKIGGEVLVNTTTAGSQYGPSITALANGNLMVAWNDSSGTGGDPNTGITGQVITTAGVKVGGEFLVNTTTALTQAASNMVKLANGNVIITWTDYSASGGDTDGAAIRAQIVDATGTKVGGEILVDTNTAGAQMAGNVTALPTGGFVVTWQDASGTLGDASGTSIKAQIFDAAGTKVGGEILVNTLTAGDQLTPAITTLDNGDFVITWYDAAVPGTPARVDLRGQLFTGTGQKVGLEFVADVPIANIAEGSPGIAALADGKFVVAHASYLDQNGTTISRGEHAHIFAGSRQLGGTTGADQLVGAAGSDTFYASPGHDTIDGRGGTSDRVIVNGDDHSLFAVTSGTVTYTWNNASLSNSLGTLDTTLTAIEQVEFDDTSAANHILNLTLPNLNGFPPRAIAVFGSGDDQIIINGSPVAAGVDADLGLGNNVIQGSVGGHDGINLFVRAGANMAIVHDIAGGITVGYSTAGGAALNTITNAENYFIEAPAGLALNIDASASVADNLNFQDTPYDDVQIGSRGSNVFVAFTQDGYIDVSGGTDYKYGNGGADDYDYSVAFPATGVDHLMDVDANDILDFSYYGDGTLRIGPNPTFIGTAAFTHVERQIRYEKIDGKTYIYTDADGDGVADGTVIIENGAFDLVLDPTNPLGGEAILKIALAQNAVNGGTGAETLAGTTGADVIRAYQGDDTIQASSGQDFVDGGAGTDLLDIVIGDPTRFAAPGGARTYVIGADRVSDASGAIDTSFTGIESIHFSTVNAGNFGDTIDARQSGGALHLVAGGGNDVFLFGAAFDAADRVDGGTGSDDQLRLQGDYAGANAIVLSADQVKNIDLILLAGGQDTRFGQPAGPDNSYDLKTDDTTVAAGETLTIQAKRLGAGETLKFDGSAETNGAFKIYSGAGNDTIIGGAEADTVSAGAGADRITGGGGADNLFGNEGNDTFVYLAASDSNAAARDHILDFASGDAIDVSALGLNSFIGSGAFGHHAGEVRAAFVGSFWQIEGDVNGDGVADLSILVTALASYGWSASDFVLAPGAQGAAASLAANRMLADDHASLPVGDVLRAGADDGDAGHAFALPAIVQLVGEHVL